VLAHLVCQHGCVLHGVPTGTTHSWVVGCMLVARLHLFWLRLA
jgi:hypothetical protein